MNRLFYMVLILLISLWMRPADAQVYVQGGAYFGQRMAGCGGGIAVPRAVSRIEKRQKKNDKAIKELERTIEDLQDTVTDTTEQLDEYKAAITGWLRNDSGYEVANAVMNQAASGGAVHSYAEACDGAGNSKDGFDMPWANFCANRPSAPMTGKGSKYAAGTPTQTPVTVGSNDWGAGGIFNPSAICRNEEYVISTKRPLLRQTLVTPGVTGVVDQATSCATAIDNYGVAVAAKNTADQQLVAAQDKLKKLEREDERLEDDKEEELEDWQDDMTEGRFSSAYCYSCENPGAQPISTWQKAAGLGMFAGIAGLSFLGAKYNIDQNQKMGWGTDPRMIYGMGANLLGMGLQTGFGMGFGAGGQYGGAYGGGSGALGCSPGYGGDPYGNPGAFGYPGNQFNPMNGMMPGMYPGAGMMPPGMMYPMSMYPNGMMNPYAMMNPNGMPAMYPVQLNNGMNPMMPGMMNPQMQMMALQQQQQQAQMYMQQLQSQMMMQQQAQQDYSQRMQLAGRLQMEMYSIQSQIAQLTGGVGGMGIGGVGGVGGYPYGSMYSPYGNMYGGGASGYFGIGGNGYGLGVSGYLGMGAGMYGGLYGGMYGGGYASGTGGLLVPTTGTYYNPGDPNVGGTIPARGQ